MLLIVPGFITDVARDPAAGADPRAAASGRWCATPGAGCSRARLDSDARRSYDVDSTRNRHRPAAASLVSDGAAAPLRTLAFGDLATGVWGCAWSDAARCSRSAGPSRALGSRGAATASAAPVRARNGRSAQRASSSSSRPKTEAARVLGDRRIRPAVPGARRRRPARRRAARVRPPWAPEHAVADARSAAVRIRSRRVRLVRARRRHRADVAASAGREGPRPRCDRGHGVRARRPDRGRRPAPVDDLRGGRASRPRRARAMARPGRFGGAVSAPRGRPSRSAPRPPGRSPELELEAYFLRWLSRGEEGLGVYLLGRTR